jgi:hypothetical protein
MPVPFKKRKRQSHEQAAERKEDPTAAPSEAAETEDEGTPRDGSAQAKSKNRDARPGEYRPL